MVYRTPRVQIGDFKFIAMNYYFVWIKSTGLFCLNLVVIKRTDQIRETGDASCTSVHQPDAVLSEQITFREDNALNKKYLVRKIYLGNLNLLLDLLINGHQRYSEHVMYSFNSPGITGTTWNGITYQITPPMQIPKFVNWQCHETETTCAIYTRIQMISPI